jgi:hypothetical protein
MWSEFLKLDNLKWLITTAAIPVTLAILAQQYQGAQTERQANEARLRLYTELLSKREEAETGVRRGIFDKVIEKYLKPEGENIAEKLVALDLLAVNFNDSLDLSPLFWQIDRQIQRQIEQGRDVGDLPRQLDRIANAVKDRQIDALEAVGARADAPIYFAESDKLGPLIDKDLSFTDPDPHAPKGQKVKRHFIVELIEHDAVQRRSLLRLRCDRRESFVWVDPFDFPLVNFIRMSKSERFTVVLVRYRPDDAQLRLIYFPSSRSGVKDKPFLDEVISDLLRKGG